MNLNLSRSRIREKIGGENGQLTRNIIMIYAVSFMELIFSVLINIFVPLFASKIDFANYRTLVLYGSYSGVLHFGLLNGFYLNVLGKEASEVNWGTVLFVRKFLIWMQIVVLPIFMLAIFVLHQSLDVKIVIGCLLAWGLSNVITFYNYLWQGTNKIWIFARVNLVSRSISIALLVLFLVLRATSTTNLIIVYLLPLFISIIIYKIHWRSLDNPQIKGKDYTFSVQDFKKLWSNGVIIFIANVCTQVMFTCDNLFVSVAFPATKFASYAFSFGVTSIIYLLADGLTAAVTPYLSRSFNSLKGDSSDTNLAYIILIWITPLTFWATSFIISRHYYQYRDSIPLILCFSAALPAAILIRSRIVSLLTSTQRGDDLCRFAIAGLIVVAISIAICYLLIGTIYSVAMGWSIGITLIGNIGLIYVASYLENLDSSQESILVFNSVFATILFLLMVNTGYSITGLIYAVVALAMLWINWNSISRKRSSV